MLLPAGLPTAVTASPGVTEAKVAVVVLVTVVELDVVTDSLPWPWPFEMVRVPPELDWTTPAAMEPLS